MSHCQYCCSVTMSAKLADLVESSAFLKAYCKRLSPTSSLGKLEELSAAVKFAKSRSRRVEARYRPVALTFRRLIRQAPGSGRPWAPAK